MAAWLLLPAFPFIPPVQMSIRRQTVQLAFLYGILALLWGDAKFYRSDWFQVGISEIVALR